ncbi:hypothetical protein K8S19_01100 [bacterium]|nr:hypothetical protein [bacterium]
MVITEEKKISNPTKPRIYIDLDYTEPKKTTIEFSESTIFLILLIAGLAGLIYLFVSG